MKAGSGDVETLSQVQKFSNIIYRIRFYTGHKSIKVKHEGRNGRCGNSLFWNRTYAWFMIYRFTDKYIWANSSQTNEFKLLSLFNIKSVSQEQVQITELFAFLPDPCVSGVQSMGPGVSTQALVETLLMWLWLMMIPTQLMMPIGQFGVDGCL